MKEILIEGDGAKWQIGISRETMQRILSCEDTRSDPGDMISLWIFYAYTARWQNVNQPRATTTYTAKGLHWSIKRVQRTKSDLLALGLIEDVKSYRENREIAGWFIRVLHLVSASATQPVSHSLHFPLSGESSDKCSRSNNRNALGEKSIARSGFAPPTVCEIFIKKAAIKLEAFLRTTRKLNSKSTDMEKWSKQIRWLLIKDMDGDIPRLKRIIKAYITNPHDQWTPKIYNAYSFRDKFDQVENWVNKNVPPPPKETIRVFQEGKDDEAWERAIKGMKVEITPDNELPE